MPAYLNTLIGFAVVMLVTSPLITILTQVAFGTAKSSREQSALAHQDIVWQFDPKGYQHLSESGEAGARQALTHP